MSFQIFSKLLTPKAGGISALNTIIRHASNERTVNKVSLLGRVGSDVILRGSEEHPVAIFKMATTQNDKTEWHRISVFRPGLREMCVSYVRQGTRLYLEGKISYGHIIDRNGASVPTCSIIANEVVFLAQPRRDMDMEYSAPRTLRSDKPPRGDLEDQDFISNDQTSSHDQSTSDDHSASHESQHTEEHHSHEQPRTDENKIN